jgi:hypothetical protein
MKKLDPVKVNGLAEIFKQNMETDHEAYLGMDELGSILGLDPEKTKDEKKIRAYIQRVREQLRELDNLIMTNKRNIGWKVAIKFESMDERSKACERAFKGILSIQKTHFNKNLTYIELSDDSLRRMQNTSIKEFCDILGDSIDRLNLALAKNPFRKKAVAAVKKSDLLD